jgi:nucleotide-binding universal stress UspA family protein
MPVEWFRGPVLVATDLGLPADEAIRQAGALAAASGEPLHVCHVLPEVLRVRVLFPHLHEGDATQLLALEQGAGERVAARVEEAAGLTRDQFTLGVETGSSHGGILRQAERVGAGLIVLGEGATAARVVRGASVPVLVARPSPSGAVLGATDFSDPSLPALKGAAAEAQRRGVPLALLHSIDIPITAYSVGITGIPFPAVTPAVMDEARSRLHDELRAFSAKAGVEAECLIKDGPPAAAILDAARLLPAALIVVGTRGRTGLARLALGSVAEAVLAKAPCSVLVVRFET